MTDRASFLLRETRPPAWLGIVAAVASVAFITALVYPLREIAPAVSVGVLYMLAVLFVSIFWGAWLGILTSLGGALAFNFFHIPPTGRFTISEAENWIALGTFFAAALVASSLAELARSRAVEARREAVRPRKPSIAFWRRIGSGTRSRPRRSKRGHCAAATS